MPGTNGNGVTHPNGANGTLANGLLEGDNPLEPYRIETFDEGFRYDITQVSWGL